MKEMVGGVSYFAEKVIVMSTCAHCTLCVSVTCQRSLAVKHILVECSDFNDTRNKYFVAPTALFWAVYQERSFFPQVMMLLNCFVVSLPCNLDPILL